jgi:hypothetical protein
MARQEGFDLASILGRLDEMPRRVNLYSRQLGDKVLGVLELVVDGEGRELGTLVEGGRMMSPSISQCRGRLGGSPRSRRRMSPERVPGKLNSWMYSSDLVSVLPNQYLTDGGCPGTISTSRIGRPAGGNRLDVCRFRWHSDGSRSTSSLNMGDER